MIATIIGISSGFFVILVLSLFKSLDKKIMYGLILCGIGFLYVGFTWTDLTSLVITASQAVCFVFLAYYGMKRNSYLLAAGYFLHGLWDLGYDILTLPKLIPPHYDLFCLSINFTMGAYLLVITYRLSNQDKHSQNNTLSV